VIHLDNISIARGPRMLLDHASLRIQAGERVGIIGSNGCGKSTLFALLQGKLNSDSGHCDVPQDWTIAAMAQEVEGTHQAALEFVLDGDSEYRALEAAIANADDHDLGELHARFAAIDGYSAPSRAHELLDGLGFAPEERMRPIREFSGGWRLRLALARTLICPSQLMLLDEPTNHLDIDALVWLEGWLQRYQGTLLLISHDRDFLDNVITRTVVFSGGKLEAYRGNYSSFERQHAERLANQQSAFEKQQERVKQIENFVARFRAKATKARQAQSRLKELERMTMIAPAHVDSVFELRLPCSDKVSNPLLNFDHADVGYANSPIVRNINLSVLPSQRIGLLGPNGAGKSTLIKSIAGDLAPIRGARHCGENLKIGYFAQHQLESLDLAATPALHIQRISPNASEQAIRDFLGGYGFIGDKALDIVGTFSGGEQARLALAIIAWQKPNLLLLDEPTNHRDLEMRHALTVARQGYEGAVIVVSHDRHLLRNTVDEFLVIADGRLQEWDGDLDDYRTLVFNQHPLTNASDPETDKSNKPDRKEERRLAAQRREAERPLRNRISKLEKSMEAKQAELNKLTSALADPALYEGEQNEKIQRLLQEQGALKSELEDIEMEWLEANEELEAFAD